jgi:Arm domain-containing DNA-binding protein
MLMDSLLRSVKRSAGPRKLSDGGGLHLLVAPNGGRYWRYSYRFKGKQKTLALGIHPDVGLAKARARHREARQLLVDGARPGPRSSA